MSGFALALALICAAPGSNVNTNTNVNTVPSRPAAAILADYVKALGGAAALRKKKTLHLVRKVSIKGMGIEGKEERYAAAGNKFLSETTLPSVGVIRQGSDGKVFWSEDPINGLRRLEGAEKEQARLDGQWNAELELARLYKATPVAPPANAPKDLQLECLELQPAKAQKVIACFDAASHHRVFQTGKQATPQGDVPFEARFSDWRDHGGITLPALEQTTAGPTSIDAHLELVEWDRKLDPALFKLKSPSAPPARPAAP